MIEVYTDGACEPVNPGGYAAYGVYIHCQNKFGGWDELYKASKIFVPKKGHEKETSNNVAEYSGLEDALMWLYDVHLQNEKILYKSDSQLVIYQNSIDPRYHRRWSMKKGFYLPIAHRCRKYLASFPNIAFQWIPREENSLADELSKAELIKVGVKFRIQPRN